MKGLAIENLATPPPLHHHKKKASNTPNLNIAIPKGFQENLLVNSLTSKLKQRRNDSNNNDRSIGNKENASRIISAKPPKQSRKSSTSAASKNACNQSGVGSDSRIGSGVSSVQSEVRKDGRHRTEHRIDSATSDKLPNLSARNEHASSRNSRRTNSADPFIGVGLCTGSLGSGRFSRISASTSFYPSTDSTGIGFDSSGADNMIKVIKRDGVFQPIDKYAPGRYLSRDVDYGPRGLACDYELFMLPINDDTAGKQNSLPASRGGKSDTSKKSMKVSWCTVMEHNNSPNGSVDGLDCRMDTIPTPIARPTQCTDNMAFKRPIYSSGKSGIKSIGVKWTVPAVASNEETEAHRSLPSACSSSSKPMWSWLITPEPGNNNNSTRNTPQQRQRSSTRIKSVGQLSRASKSKESPTPSSLGRSTSMFDIRTQHCRDVHPVATAMDRQGTSVTKTKWHVPSSTSSTLNAKQVAMERLQMVKRPGKKMLYENHNDEFGNVLKFQSAEDHEDENGPGVDYINEYKEMMMMNEMRATDDGITTTTSTRRADSNSSPTKSMSTFH